MNQSQAIRDKAIADYGKSMREWYREVYLNSEHWKNLRAQKLAEKGRKCEKCGSGTCIQIHHLNYRFIFDVQLCDLQVLCEACHKIAHCIKPTPVKPVKQAKKRSKRKSKEQTVPSLHDLPAWVMALYTVAYSKVPKGSPRGMSNGALNRVRQMLKATCQLTPELDILILSKKSGKQAREAKALLNQSKSSAQGTKSKAERKLRRLRRKMETAKKNEKAGKVKYIEEQIFSLQRKIAASTKP